MKLYHGTTAAALDTILAEGIKPRGSADGNWAADVQSHPDAVYLTECYPAHFAMSATVDKGTDRDDEQEVPGLILEIDVSKLDTHFMVPDEDVLEQIGRGRDGLKASMEERTAVYRRVLDNHMGRDTWKTSLKAMGTCAHMGVIPPEAITRYVIVEWDKLDWWIRINWLDPMITTLNYRYLGDRYRQFVSWLFGDTDMLEQISTTGISQREVPHYGLEVVTL